MSTTTSVQPGYASLEIMQRADFEWRSAAAAAGVDVSGYRPEMTLVERTAWALRHGFEIGVGCSRYSCEKSSSTLDQVLEIMRFSARHKIYIPPEHLCVDEAVSGRKSRRAGLERAQRLLLSGQAKTLVVYKLSRLMRTCYKSIAFVQEEIVEQGLRAVSVTQNVDTRDEANWRKLVYLYGLMDESLITTIGDHVRSNLKTLFEAGYCVGALTAGFDRVVVEGVFTKQNLPKTRPVLNAEFRTMFRRHVLLHLGGMSLADGHRMWVRNGGARDPRAEETQPMSYGAYRRMLSNPRYAGEWAFGRKRNVWQYKQETVRQVDQPEEEIVVKYVPELAAIKPRTFVRLQQWLAQHKMSPRSPKKLGPKSLWDYTTRFFVCGCPDCVYHNVPYYQGRSTGPTMACKAGSNCPQHITVRRDEAVRNVCDALQALVAADSALLTELVAAVSVRDDHDAVAPDRRAVLIRKRERVSGRIKGLMSMVGVGTEEEQREVNQTLAAARGERTEIDLELQAVDQESADRKKLEPQQILARAAELRNLLEQAASGTLGEEAVYQAVRVFELFTGGRIVVTTEARPGRKRPLVRGTFTPCLLSAIVNDEQASEHRAAPLSVWLRKPPQCDALAERVHQLLDDDKLSVTETTERLRGEGYRVSDSAVERAHRRYYQLRGEKPPKRSYNNGRPRKSNGTTAAAIADDVMRLMHSPEEKLHLDEIARRLGVDPHHVTDAIEIGHLARGLEVPDGRRRRKELQLPDRRGA